MIPLTTTLTAPLAWQAERGGRAFALRSGDAVAATLAFEKASGSLATARTARGAWTFKRAGFLQPRVTVREAGGELDLAVFVPTWTGSGEVEFRSGTRVHWRSYGFWSREWAFVRGADERLVTFRPEEEAPKLDAVVEVSSAARAMPETDVLLCLGIYLRALAVQEASVQVASMTS
jgi:hypothetical protein